MIVERNFMIDVERSRNMLEVACKITKPVLLSVVMVVCTETRKCEDCFEQHFRLTEPETYSQESPFTGLPNNIQIRGTSSPFAVWN